jgi:hypothetical protein
MQRKCLINLYHLRCNVVFFTYNYHTRQVENNVFRLGKCSTEFGKRNPFNTNISNFTSFYSYKKYISTKV